MKKCLCVLLALLLLIPGSVCTAVADGTNKTITGLGTGSIENPASGAGGWSYVYYGKFGSNNAPVKYRVLDKASTVFNISGATMLLDCNTVLEDRPFDTNKKTSWSNSSIKTWLNGTFINNSFSAMEKDAIAPSSKSRSVSGDGPGYETFSWVGLYGEQIFLLDAKEATRASYGYLNRPIADSTRIKSGGTGSCWWMRSPYVSQYVSNYVGQVDRTGNLMNQIADNSNSGKIGVSPAFNVKLSSVIFASKIASESKAYKLTIHDSNMEITVGSSGIVRNGNSVSIPYSITGSNANNATQVSLLILPEEYSAGKSTENYLVYDKLNVKNFSASGSGTYTLPDNLPATYYAYILAEDVNGEKETDYASTPTRVSIPPLPAISAQPSDLNLSYGYTSGNLISIAAKAPTDSEYGALGYQWYSNTTQSNSNGTAVNGATSDSYTIPAGKNAGTVEYYYCVVTATRADNSAKSITVSSAAKITVNRAAASLITKPEANSGLIYNGTAQELVKKGAADGGALLYAIGNDNKNAPTTGWSDSVPKATEAGTYYVWYKVTGDQNHTDINPACIPVTITDPSNPPSDPGNNDPGSDNPGTGDNPGENPGDNPGDNPGSATSGGAVLSINQAAGTATVTGLDGNATSVNIPDTINGCKVTEIAANAFKGKNIKKVKIGKNVKTIGKNAFNNCKNLESVSGGNGIETIGDGAFQKCVKLKAITLGKKVKKIGKNAFNGCKALAKVTVKTALLTKKTVGKSCFKGLPKKVVFKVPKKQKALYKEIFVKTGKAPKTATFK